MASRYSIEERRKIAAWMDVFQSPSIVQEKFKAWTGRDRCTIAPDDWPARAMENANHEFTWMCGRPHVTSAFHRPRSSTAIQKSSSATFDKPTPLPRVPRECQPKELSVEKSPLTSKRPVPLPRIFRRLSSSSADSCSLNQHDDVSSSPVEASVFYVATPSTAGECTLDEGSPSVTKPVTKSVIFEFDPILCRQGVENKTDVSDGALKCDGFISKKGKKPQTEDIEKQCELPVEYTNDRESIRIRSCDSFRSSSFGNAANENVKCSLIRAEVETDLHPTSQDLAIVPHISNGFNSSCSSQNSFESRSLNTAAPLKSTASGCSPPQPQPRLWKQHKAAPEIPPKSPVTKVAPKFGLSSVPPAPLSTQGSPVLKSKKPTIVTPIHIDNPFYMLVTANGTAEERNKRAYSQCGANNDTSSDCGSISSDGSVDPPKFPPPQPPSIVDDASSVEDYTTPPLFKIVVDVTKCPPAPKAARQLGSPTTCSAANPTLDHLTYLRTSYAERMATISTLNRVTASDDADVGSVAGAMMASLSTRAEEPKYPIYQNLLEICGSKEGVYARIRKPAPTTPMVQSCIPPPLPPRGQQRTAPQVAKSSMLSVTATRNVSVGATASDVVVSSRRIEHLHESLRNIPYRGFLFKIGRGRKEVSQKFVLLENGDLQLFADDKSENPQEIYHQSDIVSMGKGVDVKHNHQELATFEIVMNVCKDRRLVFGTKHVSEQEGWMQHIIQSIAPDVSVNTGVGVKKAGYLQMRMSVSGVWQTCWAVLASKKLYLWSTGDDNIRELDVRKILSMQEYDTDPQVNMATVEDQPLFVVHYPAVTLYLVSKVVLDTTDWFQRIRQASIQVGPQLEEQQLTHEDVPVIVDKCMKFISTYGISTKGIYRESGTNSKVTKLLDTFRKDAWKTHIQPDEYTEHEVANVLKRFLRLLPDALLTKSLYLQWIAAAGTPQIESVNRYMHLLSGLPKVNYMTLKKLLAHLRSVSDQQNQNLMDNSNLAAVFGPTLLSNEGDVNLANANSEMDVISDLIVHYPQLFGVSTEELEKEEKIQKALQELREARRAQKPAGDILVGVYVHSRQWGKCLNVKLSPVMTALELCLYAIQQLRLRDRVENLAIYEVVCNGEMERPLHYSEIVLVVTLRWACWSDVDARDSYLLIKKSEIFHRVMPLARQPISMFGELRFADLKSKSFKKLMFEFKNARLAYYKDAKISQPLGSWNVEDITWYIGCDSRRRAHTQWTLTFIEQKSVVKRGTKETPYFGRTICFSSEEEFYKWIAAMLVGQYPNGILPKLEPVDLLTS